MKILLSIKDCIIVEIPHSQIFICTTILEILKFDKRMIQTNKTFNKHCSISLRKKKEKNIDANVNVTNCMMKSTLF